MRERPSVFCIHFFYVEQEAHPSGKDCCSCCCCCWGYAFPERNRVSNHLFKSHFIFCPTAYASAGVYFVYCSHREGVCRAARTRSELLRLHRPLCSPPGKGCARVRRPVLNPLHANSSAVTSFAPFRARFSRFLLTSAKGVRPTCNASNQIKLTGATRNETSFQRSEHYSRG